MTITTMTRSITCMAVIAASMITYIAGARSVEPAIDYEAFLGNHDMTWNRVPVRWEIAPFSGNGKIGFQLYRRKGDPQNVISVNVGRQDYHDHRLPDHAHTWVYRSRLPLGHFRLESKGDITGADLRLDLWNAELRGTISTSCGSYHVRGLTHANTDVILFETEAEGGESVSLSWHPDEAIAPIVKSKAYDWLKDAPYPPAPKPVLSSEDGLQFCFQALHDHRGETTTGWELTGNPAGKQGLLTSVHHSFPEKNSMATVTESLQDARAAMKDGRFVAKHREWWHDYYPQSFITMDDVEKEAFYWIQMYKLASAMRGDGPVTDLMGPWYQDSNWPMIWTDLNIQITYYPHLTANRMSLGESLGKSLDRNVANLMKNVPKHWKDSIGLQTACAQDFTAYDNGRTPDLITWTLHSYWLHCEYAHDRTLMRDSLFPLLRKAANGYLNFQQDNPVESTDGKIHIKYSWSPEYPGGWRKEGHGQDVNFTIALFRWACQTLLDINAEHQLNDPLAPEWQNVVDNLVDFQVDETGLRVGKEFPYDIAHRHYSHLMPVYPLAQLSPENPAEQALVKQSVDRWIQLCEEEAASSGKLHGPLNPFAGTAAASMYAWLGDGDKALGYLDLLLKNERVGPVTMYAEGNPCLESPLNLPVSVHDMLLQSWDGKIRVFPSVPSTWKDVAFHDFRTQGAFLVSAKKTDGITQFVQVKSLAGAPCYVRTDIENPTISINGKRPKRGQVQAAAGGFSHIKLDKGDTVIFTSVKLKNADLRIEPLPVKEADRHLFGLNDKTLRLPGHNYYHKEIPASQVQEKMSPVNARYVRIELPGKSRKITIAEVQAFEKGVNVARGQKASSSSVLLGGVASRAVDGNVSGDWLIGSVTHSKSEKNPWWEVDLGRTAELEKVRVLNRWDPYVKDLDKFTLKILDENRKPVFVKEKQKAAELIEFSAQ
ncbi:MAG: discoidin domain-containing protein [Opitutales bacterium]